MKELTNDIDRLKRLVDSVEGEELVSVHFFSEAFDFVHKIQEDLIRLESVQIEKLRKDMELRQSGLSNMKRSPSFGEEKENLTVVSDNSLKAEVKNERIEMGSEVIVPTAVSDAIHEISRTETPVADANFSKSYTPDIRTLLSLNDRFRFQRELFDTDAESFNRTLDILNTKRSYDAAVKYIRENLKWNEEDETVSEFFALLDRYFSRLNEKL